ncbi:MAG: signal peptidase I [Candidatus Caenarcaniphilales bacterium]|nr:signal peptidase I [Candidatus Caenarcaniphilales bacterium]
MQTKTDKEKLNKHGEGDENKENISFFAKWNNYKLALTPPLRYSIEFVEFTFTLILLLIVIRQGIFERRYIPSESMLPNLQIQDQLIIEKVSQNLHKIGFAEDIQRGNIIVFYPPPAANRGIDLKKDIPNTFVRLTGLSSDIKIGPLTLFPFLPKAEDAYIKRVVGLPGDTIEVRAGDGVYINGNKLNEGYIMEKPLYTINNESDLFNSSINCGTPISTKMQGSNKAIVVPEDSYFCLGDNRNNSNDSHCWGFVKKNRVIGKAFSVIWRDLRLIPNFHSPYEF